MPRVTCVGGECDGLSLPVQHWPPLSNYNVCPELPPIQSYLDPIAANQVIAYHPYDRVEVRWPSGSTKAWLLMPSEMPDGERHRLLLAKGWIDG